MRKSFTLIELIVVIGIIALLSGLGVSSYNGFQQAARDSRRKADLETITNALNAYYSVNGRYPPAGTCTPGGPTCYVHSYPADNDWIPALVPAYIEKLPVDPVNNAAQPWASTNYSYTYGNVSGNGQEYDLVTRLENENDPDRCEVKLYRFGYNGANQWCGNYSGQLYDISPNSQ